MPLHSPCASLLLYLERSSFGSLHPKRPERGSDLHRINPTHQVVLEFRPAKGHNRNRNSLESLAFLKTENRIEAKVKCKKKEKILQASIDRLFLCFHLHPPLLSMIGPPARGRDLRKQKKIVNWEFFFSVFNTEKFSWQRKLNAIFPRWSPGSARRQ